MKFVPILDRVAVRLEPPRPLLGIRMATTVPPNSGVVIGVGGGRYDNGFLVPMHVQVGDRITFAEGESFEIRLDSGQTVLCILERNILGLLK